MLLITKNPVAKMPLNIETEDTTWENCYLRRWLNEDFIKEFSELERRHIICTYYDDIYNINDKIFILSEEEFSEAIVIDVRFDSWSRTISEGTPDLAIRNQVYTGDRVYSAVDELQAVCPALWLRF